MQWVLKSLEGSGSPLQHLEPPRPWWCRWQGDKLQSLIFPITRWQPSSINTLIFCWGQVLYNQFSKGNVSQTWKTSFSLTQMGTLNIGLKKLLVIESQVKIPGKAYNLMLSTESLVAAPATWLIISYQFLASNIQPCDHVAWLERSPNLAKLQSYLLFVLSPAD